MSVYVITNWYPSCSAQSPNQLRPEKAMGCHCLQKLAKLDSFSLMEKDKTLHNYTKHDKILTTVWHLKLIRFFRHLSLPKWGNQYNVTEFKIQLMYEKFMAVGHEKKVISIEFHWAYHSLLQALQHWLFFTNCKLWHLKAYRFYRDFWAFSLFLVWQVRWQKASRFLHHSPMSRPASSHSSVASA